jgi:hypothetical protein
MQVRGNSSQDHQMTNAVIDTGNEGENVITRKFLSALKLESIMESNWRGDESELTFANGEPFKPVGWIPGLSFKFENTPGGWHWAPFWVSEAGSYDVIIGMKCLLQDNIRGKLITTLVPNKKKGKGESFPTYTCI